MISANWRSRSLALLGALALYALIGGCCDGFKLSLPRMDGFLDGVFNLDADFDFDLAIDVDVDFSLEAWGGISLSGLASLGLDIDVDAVFELATLSFDVDNDGFNEELEALIVTNPQSAEATYVLYKWSGDKYTLDAQMEYLAWVDNGAVVMVTTEAGASGSMVCEHSILGDDETVCRACNDNFACEVCDENSSQESCVASGEEVVGTGVDSETDTETASDSDTGTDTTVEPDTDTETSSDTGSDYEVNVGIDIGIGF